jgi:hypothetical protein
MSSVEMSTSTTITRTSPLEKEFLQYNLDPKTISQILPYFEKNNLKAIPNDTNIINFDLKKFAVYSNFRVMSKKETDQKYTFLIHSGNYYKVIEIYKIFRHINKELEAFTLEYKLANHYKRQHMYSLILAQKTNFDLDETDYRGELRDKIKKYTEVEAMLNAKKSGLEDKWKAETKGLYDEKSALIKTNKELYQRRLSLSSKYYAIPVEERLGAKEQFLNDYRTILAQSVKNQERILEINKEVEVLERKEGLYVSQTYLYNPRSVLTVTKVSKEEYDSMLGLVGGSYNSDEYSSVTKELSGLKNKKEYILEYLDIDDAEQSESIASYYKDVKDKIKKLTKKHVKTHKPIINKDLMRELEVL